jgi:hypothetical protein
VKITSFPRSAWERTAETLCVSDRMPRETAFVGFNRQKSVMVEIEVLAGDTATTQSVAAVGSHAERGNQGLRDSSCESASLGAPSIRSTWAT